MQIENGLNSLEFGKRKAKGNGARSADPDYVEISELQDTLKLLVRKNSRVVPPTPVRNVNGAKAKESDYARIEDLRVHGHGHTPDPQPRSGRLIPYAEVHMQDNHAADKPTRLSRYAEIDLPASPPPIPKRPTQKKESLSDYAEISDMKPSRPASKSSAPPKPQPVKQFSEDSPPPLPPPSGTGLYDSLPKLSKNVSQDESDSRGKEPGPQQFYDVPRALVQRESHCLYDVPKSLGQRYSPSDLYDVPRSLQERESVPNLYNIPRPLKQGPKSYSLDHYDTLPLAGSSEGLDGFPPLTYDVPRRRGQSDSGRGTSSQDEGPSPPLYDVPRSQRQVDSGQEDSDSFRKEVSPESLYNVPRAVLEPPSPLVESNQVGVA